MTVWLVNAFWDLPQEGNRAQRYWLMSEAFARAGHDVVYWTSDFSHITKAKRILPETRIENHQFTEGKIRVVLLPTKPYEKNISLKRVFSHLALAKTFEKFASRECVVPNVVVACTPPLGLCDAARKFANQKGAKFVCDIQDAWPETFKRILPGFALTPLKIVARRIYRSADAISATGKTYLELAKKRGADAPMHFVTQVIAPRESSGGRDLKNVSALRLVYCGNMSKSYDLSTVIEAVKEMNDVTLDLAGNGPDRPKLEEMAHSCERIKFHGYLGNDELSSLLDSCDIGIIPMMSESMVTIPGKMADYSFANLRMVECLGGECKDFCEKADIGIHYEAKDVEGFKKAVKKASLLNPDFEKAKECFDGVKVMDEFVRFLDTNFQIF